MNQNILNYNSPWMALKLNQVNFQLKSEYEKHETNKQAKTKTNKIKGQKSI